MLGTAQRDIDWAGLPYAIELLGVQDIDAFVQRLLTIKHYKPESINNGTGNTIN